MGTYQPSPLPYTPYQAPTAANPIGFDNTNDPRKIAANQRQLVQGQGDALQANDEALANQYAQQATGTQAYLNPVENTLATGGGGYNTDEQSQIQLSPQEKQNIITGAGISAGAGTASAVGAAERAAAAGGGNPAALATYRARAAQTEGAQAGDAMTQARIAAQQAGSQGAQTVGNARMGQQQQGLGYYQGLQSQQNQNALSEQGLQQGAYGTQTSGTGQAAGLGVQASQTPSTSDKIIGGIAGAAKAFLADGTSSYGGMDAVLGEDGPEEIVEHASDPVRSHTKFMDMGGFAAEGDAPVGDAATTPYTGAGTTGAAKRPSFGRQLLNNYLTNSQKPAAPGAGDKQPAWNPTTPYQDLGSAIGGIGGALAKGGFSALADGTAGYMDGDQMMADGDSENPILDNYLSDSMRDELAAAPATPAPAQTPPGGQSNSGSSIGSAIGSVAKAALPFLAFLSDGSAGGGYRASAMGAPYAPSTGHMLPGAQMAEPPVLEALTGRSYPTQMDIENDERVTREAVSRETGRHDADLVTTPHMADGGSAASYRAMRDYAPPIAKPPLPAGLQGRPEDVQSDIDSTEQAMQSAGRREQRERQNPDGRGFADWAHHDMQSLANSAMQKRRIPYASMADGGFPADEPGLPKAPTFNPGKLITSPTRVHLDPGDKVVPLSYRPKAKVRPSAALPALGNVHMNPRLRHSYGAARA